MGAYINPTTGSKEQWLRDKGIEISLDEFNFNEALKGNMMLVVLVDNGPFTAAGIAYSPTEAREFTDQSDPRRKQFFLCDIDDLLSVSNLKDYVFDCR